MSGVLAGISVTCFAASYAVAWALEISRLFFQSGVRGAVMIGFAAAGLLAHTLYLAYRGFSASASPLSSSFDWYLLAAWLLIVVYLHLAFYQPRRAIGLFVLPIALVLVLLAATFASREPIAPEPASRWWGTIHGLFLLLGTVTVILGFVVGLMYLLQANRLKHKRLPPAGMRLPSLEWLERVDLRLLFGSTLLVAIGFVAGLVLKGVRSEPILRWADPVEIALAGMLAWLVAATSFVAIYRPARHGRKVAYLSLTSFVLLAVVLAVLLFVSSGHGGAHSLSDRSARLGSGASAAPGSAP